MLFKLRLQQSPTTPLRYKEKIMAGKIMDGWITDGQVAWKETFHNFHRTDGDQK